jgi:hypothetical protein
MVGAAHSVWIQALGLLGNRVNGLRCGRIAKGGVLADCGVGLGDARDSPLAEGEGNTVGDSLDAAIIAHDSTSS